LRLRDGGQLDARWQTLNDTGAGSWLTSVFERTVAIPPAAIESFTQPGAVAFALPDEFWEARLQDGSVLRGRLISLNRETAVWHCLAVNAEVVLARGAIVELRRRVGMATVVYPGLQGLRGWRDEWGRTTALDRRGAVQIEGPGILRADLGLPERSVSDIEISWRGRPNFGLQWGVRSLGDVDGPVEPDGTVPREPRLEAPPEEQAVPRGAELRPFNLEVARGELLAMAETRRGIVQQSVKTLTEPGGRLKVRVHLDQKQGRMVITTPSGEVLCHLLAREPDRAPGGALRLVNGRGAVRLERLKISHWNGVLPTPAQELSVAPSERRVHLVTQADTRLEREEGVIRTGSGPTLREVPLSRVDVLTLATPGRGSSTPGEPLATVVELVDGSQWRGAWQGEETGLVISHPVLVGSWEIPLRAIRSVTWRASSVSPVVATASGVAGVLQTQTVALAGTLVGVRSTPGGPRLAWQPSWGGSAFPLRVGLAARMMFRDEAWSAAGRDSPRRRGGGRETTEIDPNTDPFPPGARFSLRLMSGENLACDSVEWSDNRLTVTIGGGDRREFAESDLQSLEFLSTDSDGSDLSSTLREALVTIPRLRQTRPPTHLVRSRSGDFLRGRLLRLDERELVLEIRDREQTLSRELVAAIVWLHPPTEFSPPVVEGSSPSLNRPRLQAWKRGRAGVGLTPMRLEETHLVCEDSLGREVTLALEELDGLLLGDWLAREARPGAAWRWKPAVQPRFVEETTSP
jgi:hypothetical protein